MPSPPSRVGLGVHLESLRTPFPALLTAVRELLGDALITYVCDATKFDLDAWASGTTQPSRDVQNRVRIVFGMTQVIAEMDGQATTQAWFCGRHPELDDVSPARILRTSTARDAYMVLIGATRNWQDFGAS